MEALVALVMLAAVGFVGWKIFKRVVDSQTRQNIGGLLKIMGILFGMLALLVLFVQFSR